jgi:uracil phosphoribosyltransferase
LYREEKTHSIVEYYFKVPDDISSRTVLILDPMLASGQSAVIAVNRVKKKSPRQIFFVCLLSSPEGLEYFQSFHPDVPIFTAAIDERLNDKQYIVPGLGDAGDRLYGTQ